MEVFRLSTGTVDNDVDKALLTSQNARHCRQANKLLVTKAKIKPFEIKGLDSRPRSTGGPGRKIPHARPTGDNWRRTAGKSLPISSNLD
jgi:hypothetical protein